MECSYMNRWQVTLTSSLPSKQGRKQGYRTPLFLSNHRNQIHLGRDVSMNVTEEKQVFLPHL